MALALLVFAAGVGVAIGLVGVGGVLLAPALVQVGGMTPQSAVATSTWACLFTGVVGTAAYARARAISWSMLGRLALGVVPAAFLGARTNALLRGDVILLLISALTLLVGVQQLWSRRQRPAGPELGAARLVVIGAAVGFGSALTGTGGPVLLVPVLLALGVAPLPAVAVSQAVQLPVVGAASIGYLQAGLTDVRLGSLLGLAAGAGVLGAALFAPRLDPARLRQAVAVACVSVGLFLLIRTASTMG